MPRIHARRLAAGLLFFVPSLLSAQGEQRLVRGVVTDTTGAAVPYVNVLVGRDLRVTDDSGRFSVALNNRKATTFEFRRIGYHPTDFQLVAGGDTTFSVVLIPNAQLLSGAVVKVREQMVKLERADFYRRMTDRETGINAGHFITAEEIEKRGFPYQFTILLDAIPSVSVRTDRGLRVPMGTGGCIMTTYLDGSRLVAYSQQRLSEATGFYTKNSRPPDHPPGGGLDGMIRSSSVAGIEVYTRASQAPPQFQSLNGNCGVILIWTR
jgi:hypothetical protein